MAALAVCLLVVGIDKNSLLLCVGGWLLAALTFFIKPSGSLVMAATMGIATIEFVLDIFVIRTSALTLRLAAWVFLSCIPIFGLAFWAALGSDYLRKEIVLAGIKATGILRMISEGQDLTAVFALFIVPVIGWWWFCPMAFCMILLTIDTVQHR